MSVSEKEAEGWIMNEADRAARQQLVGDESLALQLRACSAWRKQIEDASLQAVQVVPTYQCGSPGVFANTHYQSPDELTALRLRASALEEALRVSAAQLSDANSALRALYQSVTAHDDALRVASQELSDANAIIESWRAAWRARDEAEGAALPSDPPQSESPDAAPKRGAVDEVVDALDKRLVGRTDRVRLRGALDKADAPLTGRAAGDEALKRISGLGALQGDRR